MPIDLKTLADSVVQTVKAAMGPVLERVAAVEARLSGVDGLRDRVVAVETKAASFVAPEPVTFDVAPLQAQIDLLQKELRACQERLLVYETKASMPLPALEAKEVDLTPVLERVAKLELKAVELAPVLELSKDVNALRERVAVVEVKPLLPGPAGPAGRDGVDGKDGKDGADGLGFDDAVVEHDGERTFTLKYARGERVKTAGVFTIPVDIYRGTYIRGKTYERGECVTWGGSEFHANETTNAVPGESKSWTLKVKRGRDGKDGKDAEVLPVVSIGKP